MALTWAQLRDLSLAAAGSLKAAGIEPGDRVALILPNVPAFPVLFFGTLMAGGTVVPMNPLLKAQEIDYYFSDSGATVAFVWGDFLDEARKGAEGPGTRVVQSGPMGPSEEDLPRAEPLPAAVERDDSDTGRHPLHLRDDRPAQGRRAHAPQPQPQRAALRRGDPADRRRRRDHGLPAAVPRLRARRRPAGGDRQRGLARPHPPVRPGKALEVIAREKVTIFEGVPTMYAALLHHPDGASTDTASLRVCASGGSAMPAEVMKAFEEKYGCMILEGYGLSETSPVASFNMPDRERKPGTIGVAIPGCEMRVVDLEGKDVPVGEVGEIAIRGDNVMKGYWGKPGGHLRGHPRRLVPHR